MYCRGQPNLTHTKLGWTLCFQQGTQKIAWWSLRKTPVWMSSWVNRKSHYLQSKCMQRTTVLCLERRSSTQKKRQCQEIWVRSDTSEDLQASFCFPDFAASTNFRRIMSYTLDLRFLLTSFCDKDWGICWGLRGKKPRPSQVECEAI